MVERLVPGSLIEFKISFTETDLAETAAQAHVTHKIHSKLIHKATTEAYIHLFATVQPKTRSKHMVRLAYYFFSISPVTSGMT